MAERIKGNCGPEFAQACRDQGGWFDPVGCACVLVRNAETTVARKSNTPLLVVGVVALALMWTFSRRQ